MKVDRYAPMRLGVDEAFLQAAATSVALVAAGREVTFGELRLRVDARRAHLDLDDRCLVVLAGPPSLDWVITYLALLRDRHVPLLAADHIDELVDVWSPAAVVTVDRGGFALNRLREAPRRTLHPDLALLLSTSGSTGSPKLVRLSQNNVLSNARAIADYLGLTPADRGITSLPLHYCYGLSVLHSHLLVGASVVLTDASVVDPCFRTALLDHGVTNVAGVPHTFDLLERVGADQLSVPTLRFITQAGGKLPPDAVVRWLDRAGEWGCEFFVMYGQTEATARMAYLPPSLASRYPGAIGRPIDGGEFRLDNRTADGVGEIVYRGPNVMMGYADQDEDLALGQTIDELRTGDLARFHAAGEVYEIVGRNSRFVKPFGLRIDLDAVEAEVRSRLDTDEVAVAGDDQSILISAPGGDRNAIESMVRERTNLPTSHIVIDTTTSISRTASGKIDYAAVAIAANSNARRDCPTTPTAAGIIGIVLGRASVSPHDTFVSLGGDSLSYVECSIRLESVLGRLPPDWHLRPIGTLQPRPRPRRVFATIDTTVALRAIAICLVVATHMHLWFFPGGAHLLLAVVGYNLSRFLLPIEPVRERANSAARTIARIAVPTIAMVGIGTLLGATYGLGTLFFVNNYTGPASHALDHWHFWFIEVFVHAVVVLSLLLAVPAVRRLERRFSYLFPLAVLAVLLVFRMEWAWMGDWYNLRFRTHGVAWLVALGWLVHRSDTTSKRLATAAIVLLVVPDFFQYAPREAFIGCSLLVLLWCREITVPRVAVRPLALLASYSMWIYITHFTIWPPLVEVLGIEAAYVPTLLGGVAIGITVERAAALVKNAVATRGSVARKLSFVRIA